LIKQDTSQFEVYLSITWRFESCGTERTGLEVRTGSAAVATDDLLLRGERMEGGQTRSVCGVVKQVKVEQEKSREGMREDIQ
jgi:hypothetical protein